MKKYLLMIGILVLMMVPMVLPAADSTATDPLMGAAELGTRENPELVWKSGKINRVDEIGMTIDDVFYEFNPDTTFYSTSGIKITSSNFFPGTSVKIVLKNDMKTVVSVVKQ